MKELITGKIARVNGSKYGSCETERVCGNRFYPDLELPVFGTGSFLETGKGLAVFEYF